MGLNIRIAMGWAMALWFLIRVRLLGGFRTAFRSETMLVSSNWNETWEELYTEDLFMIT